MHRKITFAEPGILLETKIPFWMPFKVAALVDEAAWRKGAAESLRRDLAITDPDEDVFRFDDDHGTIVTHERLYYPLDLLRNDLGVREAAYVVRLIKLASQIEAASVEEDLLARCRRAFLA